MITIPSYEDLTPGIPDVADAKRADQLALLLDNSQLPSPKGARMAKPGSNSVASSRWELGIGSSYACLRATDGQPPTANRELPALLAVARDFSPRVRRVSDREVVLDVSGLGRLIGEPPVILRELTRALREAGTAGAAAIGPTQTIARLRAACGNPAATIATLPVASLQPPLESLPHGINDRDRARPYEIFENWGIATLGDLAALPPDALASRLGRRGTALQRLARGEDLRPFVPDADTPRYRERLELEWPIETLEPLSFVLPRLLDPLSAALERADRGAAAIRLELRLTDRSTDARVLQLPAAMRDARVLRTLLLLDLEARPPSPLRGVGETTPASAGIDVITIEIDPAPARITQFSLLTRALPPPETLSALIARLSALVGESRVGSPALVDSHRPDGFEMVRYAPDSVGRTAQVRVAIPTVMPDLSGPAYTDLSGPAYTDLSGPAYTDLSGPAYTNLKGPAYTNLRGPAYMRRRRPPVAIRVSVTRGQPVHVASSRRGIPYGAITQASGPWRSSGEWWRSPVTPKPRSGEGGWDRNEWDVALQSGAVCRIYQDRTTDRWFLEGTYD